jgi:DNA-binding beta-propeller fold protein YncE
MTIILSWSRLPALAPDVPVPNAPVSSVFENLWLAGRRVSVLGRITVPGYPSGVLSSPAVFSADGGRALILTTASGPTGAPTRMAVINTATGRQIGTTLTLDPTLIGAPVVGADGSHVFVTTTDATNTRVTVISTATRALTTTTFALPGEPISAELNADGSRLLVTTSDATMTRVAVINTATGSQAGTTVAVDGNPVGTLVLSADGGRAFITTSDATTTRVAVINTATGAQIGNTFGVDKPPAARTVLSADGSRALITTYDATTNQATVMNTATQTGTTFTLPFQISETPVLNADGSRVLVTTEAGDFATGTYTAQMAVVDTTTGAQVGTTLIVTGKEANSRLVSADRGRVVSITSATDPTTGVDTTRIAAIDLATGTQTSTALTGTWDTPLLGTDFRPQLSGADGSRVLLARGVTNPTTGAPTTQVAVIDTTTGAQIGTTITLPGEQFGSRLVSTDGSRALIITNIYDGRTSTNYTRLTVIDTTTGMQIGTTTTLTGFLNGPVQSSADRAVIATISSNFATTGQATTEAAVINTTTGTQVGTTLTLHDDTGTAVISADGTRAVVNDGTQLAVIDTATGIQIKPTVGGGHSAQLTADGTRAVVTTPIYNLFTGTYKTKVAVLKTSG